MPSFARRAGIAFFDTPIGPFPYAVPGTPILGHAYFTGHAYFGHAYFQRPADCWGADDGERVGSAGG